MWEKKDGETHNGVEFVRILILSAWLTAPTIAWVHTSDARAIPKINSAKFLLLWQWHTYSRTVRHAWASNWCVHKKTRTWRGIFSRYVCSTWGFSVGIKHTFYTLGVVIICYGRLAVTHYIACPMFAFIYFFLHGWTTTAKTVTRIRSFVCVCVVHSVFPQARARVIACVSPNLMDCAIVYGHMHEPSVNA